MGLVLLTRDANENAAMEALLEGKRILTYSFPLVELKATEFDWISIGKYDSLIITSKFAAQIAARNITNQVLILVVGQESANILRANRAINVVKVFKNSADLCEDIKKNVNLLNFAYLSGNIIKRDIEKVDRYIIYEAVYASKLSLELEQKIKDMEISTIMLYSENCAKTFIDLCKQSNLCGYLKNMVAVVLSFEIKKVVEKYMDKVFYSKEPSNALMLDLICKLYE